MAFYRAYTVADDGEFASAVDLDCADDEAAIEAARRLLNGRNIEIWQGERKVFLLEATK